MDCVERFDLVDSWELCVVNVGSDILEEAPTGNFLYWKFKQKRSNNKKKKYI